MGRILRTGASCVAILGLTALVLAQPQTAAAVGPEVYVDRTVACSDTGPGTGMTPYCTLAKGVAALAAGRTLFVGNGTYAETINPAVSGTSTAPVTIAAWPGRHPVVGTGVPNGVLVSSRAYVTVQGLTVTGTTKDGISVSGGNHISVLGNEVSFAGRPASGAIARGIVLSGSSDDLVSHNYTHDNSDTGIYLGGTTTAATVSWNESSANAEGYQRNANGINVVASGNTIIGNRTHDNEDSGIQFYTGGNNNLTTLNVTWGNGDHGIDDLNVTGGRIIGNTVYRNCTTGINLEGTSGNFLIKDNIAVDNAVYPTYKGIACSRRGGNIGIWDSAPPSTVVDHNLVWLTKAGAMYVFGSSYSSLAAMQAATHQEAHGIQADPLFVAASAADLMLKPGSPAIDRADSGVVGEQATDVLGAARVDDPVSPNTAAEGPRLFDDLGAYEFQPQVAPPPAPPRAALSVTPSSGTAPVQVLADGSGSTDPQGQALSYSFDFGDGTTTGPQASATAAHTYAAAGSYSLRLTVTDTSGLSDVTTRTVTVSPPPTPPTAALTVTPSSGTAPVQVSADASGSTDPQGQALSYTFDFGDGTSTGTQASATAAHTYTAAGTYTVTVTAIDASGLTNAASQPVSVTAPPPPPDPQPPTAALIVTPSSGAAPVQVTADASASIDPQGQALSYSFDFGDGTSTGPQASASAAHTYAAAATYTVTVTAIDASGLTNAASQTVTVTAPPPPPDPQPPTAALIVTPASGAAPVQVTADASASTDPQGQALSYSFDFGDGTTTGPQTSASAAHTYTAAGTYTVTVTAIDASGLTNAASQPVTVTAPPPSSPPTARLGVSPSGGTAPVTVTADASASTDPQGETLSYAFDFGDGTVTGPQAGATATHTYPAAGSFQVKVTVTDTEGLTGSTTQTVTVTAPPPSSPPTARLGVSPSGGTAPVTVTADASASSDPQGETLSYAFDFGDGTVTGPQAGATATHTYPASGTFQVKVTVTDTEGLIGSTTQTVTVTAPPPAQPPAYVSAIATNYSSTSHTSGSVTVWRTDGVKAGDLAVVTLQLAGTKPTGAITGTDTAGNSYQVAADVSDAAGNRLVVLTGVVAHALAAGGKITVSFPTAAGYRITGDELSGLSGPDRSATAVGAAGGFSSGPAQAVVGNEIAFAAVSVPVGTAASTWTAGWRDLGSYAVGQRYLGRAYEPAATAGDYTGSGTASGAWLAVLVTLRP